MMAVAEAPRFDGLRAIFINCTLKPSPQRSNTSGLLERSAAITRERGVEVEEARAVAKVTHFREVTGDGGQ